MKLSLPAVIVDVFFIRVLPKHQIASTKSTNKFQKTVRGDPKGSFLGSALSASQGIGTGLAIASLFMLLYLKRAYRR